MKEESHAKAQRREGPGEETDLILTGLPLGFLVNFGEELMRTGIHRIIKSRIAR